MRHPLTAQNESTLRPSPAPVISKATRALSSPPGDMDEIATTVMSPKRSGIGGGRSLMPQYRPFSDRVDFTDNTVENGKERVGTRAYTLGMSQSHKMIRRRLGIDIGLLEAKAVESTTKSARVRVSRAMLARKSSRKRSGGFHPRSQVGHLYARFGLI